MRLIILGILASIFLSQFILADNYQNSSMSVSVDIIEPVSKIDISPNQIHLGSVTTGYTTDAVKINVTNTGTLDLKIQPMLDSDADDIFRNLVFSNTATCASETTCIKIESYSFNLSRPDEIGEETLKSFYLKLDLRNYGEEILHDYSNLTTDIIFWVMPQ